MKNPPARVTFKTKRRKQTNRQMERTRHRIKRGKLCALPFSLLEDIVKYHHVIFYTKPGCPKS
jgi:hypothetical protein